MPKLLKRRLLWGLLLLAMVLGAGYLLVPVSEGRVSQANCHKIQLGWSLAQVENLLGENAVAHRLQRKPLPDISVVVPWYDEDDNRIEVCFQSQADARSLEVTEKKFRSNWALLF